MLSLSRRVAPGVSGGFWPRRSAIPTQPYLVRREQPLGQETLFGSGERELPHAKQALVIHGDDLPTVGEDPPIPLLERRCISGRAVTRHRLPPTRPVASLSTYVAGGHAAVGRR